MKREMKETAGASESSLGGQGGRLGQTGRKA